jgi:hypothetical protein
LNQLNPVIFIELPQFVLTISAAGFYRFDQGSGRYKLPVKTGA